MRSVPQISEKSLIFRRFSEHFEKYIDVKKSLFLAQNQNSDSYKMLLSYKGNFCMRWNFDILII